MSVRLVIKIKKLSRTTVVHRIERLYQLPLKVHDLPLFQMKFPSSPTTNSTGISSTSPTVRLIINRPIMKFPINKIHLLTKHTRKHQIGQHPILHRLDIHLHHHFRLAIAPAVNPAILPKHFFRKTPPPNLLADPIDESNRRHHLLHRPLPDQPVVSKANLLLMPVPIVIKGPIPVRIRHSKRQVMVSPSQLTEVPRQIDVTLAMDRVWFEGEDAKVVVVTMRAELLVE
mmetsp:Transcript_6540/g.13861  ORF Transcript_6540/g.13861 Transcript_6540/m.13861 type:complete len:229 (-) Transcript_6540:447-1133(-)